MKNCYFLFENGADKTDQFVVYAFNDGSAIAEVNSKKGYDNNYILTGITFTSFYQARKETSPKLDLL